MMVEALIRKEEMISGGHNTVDGSPAGGAVVGMDLIPSPRVVRDDDVGTVRADEGRHLSPHAHRVLEFTIDMTEEHDRRRAQGIGGCLLLGSPDFDQRRRILVGFPGALRSVGHDRHHDVTAGPGPPGQRSAGSELDVVGMGADGESTFRCLEGIEARFEIGVKVGHAGALCHVIPSAWAVSRSWGVSRSRARPRRTRTSALSPADRRW